MIDKETKKGVFVKGIDSKIYCFESLFFEKQQNLDGIIVKNRIVKFFLKCIILV